MDSFVQGLADVYDGITYVIARGAYWLSVAMLAAAALAVVAMLVDLALTPARRFKGADRAAQPRDGIILIGQIMAGIALLGGLVFVARDTAAHCVIREADSEVELEVDFDRLSEDDLEGLVGSGSQVSPDFVPEYFCTEVVAGLTSGSLEEVLDPKDLEDISNEVLEGSWEGTWIPTNPDVWQEITALAGGAALMAILVMYRRADEERQAAMAWYVWLAFAASGAVAVGLAWVQREDSAIPFMGLLLAAFVIARAWFTLARPEVRFDPSKVEVARESRTESPLVVENLGMVYELPDGGSVEALKDVSFTLEPGRLLTLLGPSGCGKTTLLNIIAGFLDPTSGDVKLGSDPITGPGQDRGMVFQRGALFEWLSVNDNVGFGARMNGRSRPASREAVQDLLRIVGLQDFGDKAVYELSGGMQQRVALARCLANDPKIILMDEPLGALDALTREKMQSLVLNLWNETGKTIVLVTHSVEEALYLGDQLFVMAPRPGRIERTYDLPFAQEALSADARELKTSPEFIETREEILTMIWEMEEQIMGTGGGV